MGIIEDAAGALAQAQSMAKEHPDEIKAAIDKGEEAINSATGGQFKDAIEQVANQAEGFLK
jgi:dihydropteroate synthase